MHLGWILIINLFLIDQGLSHSCDEEKQYHERQCELEKHGSYVDCVKTRMKRYSSNCVYEENCHRCDCNSCRYSICGRQCDSCCSSCCPNFVQCTTNHCCHKQCHNECHTFTCRSECRKSCYHTINTDTDRVREVEPARYVDERSKYDVSSSQQNTTTQNKHNITTIINLKNVINNTNFLDIPINLNYTNRNNISLVEQNLPGDGGGRSSSENCCIVISPRQCVSIMAQPYIRCFHTRSRQCGSFCTTSIVHQERREICNTINDQGYPIDCRQQFTYVPQPKPKCVYTMSWPYVSCGVQTSSMSCDGCYGQYGMGAYGTGAFGMETGGQYGMGTSNGCPPECYRNVNVGPLYGQGPFAQPNFNTYPNICAYAPRICGMDQTYSTITEVVPSFPSNNSNTTHPPVTNPGVPEL